MSITVIALLSVLSFAAFGKITEARNNSKCAANLRQLGAATLLFTTDHNNRYPVLSHSENGTYQSFWYRELRVYLGAKSTTLDYNPTTGKQYNLPVFYCPSIDKDKAYPHTHYGANRYVFIAPDEENPMIMNSVHNIPEPSHTALFSEVLNPTSSTYPQAGWQAVPYRIKAAKDDYIPVDRHNGHVNMVFADGHTESLEAAELKEKIDYYFGEDYFE